MSVAAQECCVLAKLLEAADVVLAEGPAVVAKRDSEEELFWALRGGGGNFGIVTAMCPKLHRLPSVRSGMLIYPFAEANAARARKRSAIQPLIRITTARASV
jgi:FAD/FMN-containing dehydrogenase